MFAIDRNVETAVCFCFRLHPVLGGLAVLCCRSIFAPTVPSARCIYALDCIANVDADPPLLSDLLADAAVTAVWVRFRNMNHMWLCDGDALRVAPLDN